ncbi:MAG: 16S rRNA methyltransferase [Thermoprotei archaeon]
MLNVILLESSISLLPRRFWDWPEAKAYYRRFNVRPEDQVLDVSFHFRIVKALGNPKLGRPDIVHLTLLVVLSLPRKMIGDIFIHTIEGKIIRVSREVRPPKNYYRFLGLVSQLLREGRVPPEGEPLMEVLPQTSLRDLVQGKLILLDEKGEIRSPEEVCDLAEGKFLGIGAFPHGEFAKEIYDLAVKRISIHSEVLEAYQTVCLLGSPCWSKSALK